MTAIVTGIECIHASQAPQVKLLIALNSLPSTDHCLIGAMEGEYSDAMSTTSRSGKTYYTRRKP